VSGADERRLDAGRRRHRELAMGECVALHSSRDSHRIYRVNTMAHGAAKMQDIRAVANTIAIDRALTHAPQRRVCATPMPAMLLLTRWGI
jgi:hypothetical protein